MTAAQIGRYGALAYPPSVTRRPYVIAAAVFVLVLSACSKSYDAWFVNPCGHPLTIKTFYVERGTDPPRKSADLIAQAVLPPGAVTKVKDAFQDANGFLWFIETEGGTTIERSKEQMPEWIVALPATACRT